MKRIVIIILTLLICANTFGQSNKPKLVVNIVISQLSPDYLKIYANGLSDRGFLKVAKQGVQFKDARYNFMQTITPATLATLTTGANPSSHGITTTEWFDYVTNKKVDLIADNTVKGLGCDEGLADYSPTHITVPTLGDMLAGDNANNRVVTIALDPVSAIVMGGNDSQVYWVDESRFSWVSSTAYMKSLPQWVDDYNALRIPTQYLENKWVPLKKTLEYTNTKYSDIVIKDNSKLKDRILGAFKKDEIKRDYQRLLYSPVANTLVTEFAKQAIMHNQLGGGKNDRVDMLNICYDAPRYIGESYGDNTIEFEDMIYRLDEEIAELISFVSSQRGDKDVLFVITSDHGSSRAQNNEKPKLFNAGQFKVILNSFLGAQYGAGDWVLGYRDRQVYLNRNLIYTKNLNIEEVQNRAAAFALQFRGISHVLTATAMQSSYFGDSYAQKMQNSFYPKRCGDLVINLMPGWIEQDKNAQTLSGSMYDYDAHVPLMIYGCGIAPTVISTPVDMQDVAPTLARIMQINKPIASTGGVINQIVTLFEQEK